MIRSKTQLMTNSTKHRFEVHMDKKYIEYNYLGQLVYIVSFNGKQIYILLELASTSIAVLQSLPDKSGGGIFIFRTVEIFYNL